MATVEQTAGCPAFRWLVHAILCHGRRRPATHDLQRHTGQSRLCPRIGVRELQVRATRSKRLLRRSR
jgi:hypothetical protein